MESGLEIDRRMMRRALALASLGRGSTSPNPLVGAVLARGAQVVAQGYHRRAGEPHAEAMALGAARGAARGATLYTNLEPCCHTGRTPPCVGEILKARVARVVAAMRDPDPRVNGGGFEALRRNGVLVETGLCREEAARLNRAFTKFVRHGVPFVTLKAGASLDGRIATRSGHSRWITSPEARRHARVLRLEHDAVMVGIATVIADDPRLNLRPASFFRSPLLRVVMDSRLRFPLRARMTSTLAEAPLLIFAARDASRRRAKLLLRRGIEIERLPSRRGRLDLRSALKRLAQRGVTNLLVEGGGELHSSFVEQRLADRLVLYLAPRLIGGRDARPLVGGRGPDGLAGSARLGSMRLSRVGEEILVEADFRP